MAATSTSSKCAGAVLGARIIGTSELQDYRLLFKGSKTGSYLTVEPKKGCTVPVAVWGGHRPG